MAVSFKASWLWSAAGCALALGLAPAALAQASGPQTVATTAGPAQDADDQIDPSRITSADTVVVLGEITYRNRSEETAPVLEYGLDYFQRFEPLTVGDALKRVPSVTFLSDVLESDGVRLRGLDPAYTQILINGEKVPGAGDSSGAFGNGADGAFFVDRIPAELIERIEIVRSSSANRSGDSVAGAVNIVLRDAFSLDGGYIRAGASMYDDKRVREILGGVWGGEVGGGRLLLGANVQGRRNPKEKFSTRFDEPGGDIDTIERQFDTRDGTDYSANASYQIDLGSSELNLSGFVVHTERLQEETSFEYEGGDENLSDLALINVNDADITQDSYSLNGAYRFDMLGGRTALKLGYANFEDDTFEFEEETVYLDDSTPFPDGDVFEGAGVLSDIKDSEISAKLEHQRDLTDTLQLEFGLQYEMKERDTLITESEDIELDLAPGTVLPPLSATRPFVDFEAIDGGDNTIEQTRLDPYVMLSGDAGAFAWEAGLRWETTEVTVDERTAGVSQSTDYNILLPSAHMKWDLTSVDRISASAARTIRRPSFTFLSPAVLEGELGDNDFIGDPNLEPETATGFDLGYERRLGRAGVVGLNFFYRDVQDLLEVYNTGAPSADACESFEDDTGFECGETGAPPIDPDSFVYSARNTGDGKVWGLEFDMSTPLTAIGLPDTGVFVNYSLLDSEVNDEFGERRFNSQSDYVYNVGFIHDLTALNAAFGVTYRKQGDAESRVVGEEVVTSYGGVLEAFIEKSFGENFTVRLTGSNLTNGTKDEIFDKFDNGADQIDRDYDEYEIESEEAGPVFQLVGRMSF